MRLIAYLPAALLATALALMSGCISAPPADTPAVSIVSSLSFSNAMSGKRDGLRSAWPMDQLSQTTERYPLAQIKQCDKAGAACSWGVLSARRTFGKVRPVAAGVALSYELVLDVDRSHRVHGKEQNAAMTIPADVPALQLKRTIAREVVLEYGKVQRIEIEHGISFELCALRLDAARRPLDKCEIDYI
jgi:hypothetical protein